MTLLELVQQSQFQAAIQSCKSWSDWHLKHQNGLNFWSLKWKNLTPAWEQNKGYWPICPGRLSRALSLPHFIRFAFPADHPGQLPCAPAQLWQSVVLSMTAMSFQLTCKRLFSSSDGTMLCLPDFCDPQWGQTSCWVSVLRHACCWSCSYLPVGTRLSPSLCQWAFGISLTMSHFCWLIWWSRSGCCFLTMPHFWFFLYH